MAKENIVENTLFQIKNLEESLKKNAQGILSSTMKKEINSLVKESLMEQEEVGNAMPTDDQEPDLNQLGNQPEMGQLQMGDETGGDETGGIEEPIDADAGLSSPEDMDDETIDMTDATDDEVIKVFKAMGDSDGIVVTKDNNIITLTDDDDEYIIKLNESMENFEEINMEEDLYEMDDYSFEDEEDDMSFEDEEDDMSFDDEEDDDMEYSFDDEEIIYELEMDANQVDASTLNEYEDEEDDMSFDDEDMSFDDEYLADLDDEEFEEGLYESKSFSPKGKVGRLKKVDFKSNTVGGFNEKRKEAFGGKVKAHGTGKAKFTYKDGENLDGEFKIKPKSKKVETKEASRFVKSVDRKVKRGLMAAPGQLKEEVVELRTKNQEYRKALDLFRTKLNEVAVFNSNLAYATRLFTEHSTTKQEKINILRRFDDVETLKESKNLYRVIKNELSDGTLNESVSLNESIQRTVNNSVSSGSAVNLIESKTYENPQFLRMKDLMTKIK
jgi:hypothetical protein